MGGRVASMVADALFAAGRIAGLLCLGYPFHPPGKPEQLRTKHLVGAEDPGADLPGHARRIRHARRGRRPTSCRQRIEMLWLEDGDHDLKPRKSVSGIAPPIT